MIVPMVVARECHELWARCKKIYPSFIEPRVTIHANGQAAAWARWKGNEYMIDLNQAYLISNSKAMLEQTIPHEFAHILVWQRYGKKTRPHGAEWYAMYGALTGNTPSRTHNYGDVKVAQVKKQDIMTRLAEKALEELG